MTLQCFRSPSLRCSWLSFWSVFVSSWRCCPFSPDSSERGHLVEMLPGLPAGALIAADAGFVGYESARAILDSGRQLLVRVGSNVQLLRKLGYARESAGAVDLWPDYAARKQQPPLVLRLVTSHHGRPSGLSGDEFALDDRPFRSTDLRALRAVLGDRTVRSHVLEKPSSIPIHRQNKASRNYPRKKRESPPRRAANRHRQPLPTTTCRDAGKPNLKNGLTALGGTRRDIREHCFSEDSEAVALPR